MALPAAAIRSSGRASWIAAPIGPSLRNRRGMSTENMPSRCSEETVPLSVAYDPREPVEGRRVDAGFT